jgi:hypothetical protein
MVRTTVIVSIHSTKACVNGQTTIRLTDGLIMRYTIHQHERNSVAYRHERHSVAYRPFLINTVADCVVSGPSKETRRVANANRTNKYQKLCQCIDSQ